MSRMSKFEEFYYCRSNSEGQRDVVKLVFVVKQTSKVTQIACYLHHLATQPWRGVWERGEPRNPISWYDVLTLTADHESQTLSLGPSDIIISEPTLRNRGVGRCMIARMAKVLSELAPETDNYIGESIVLSQKDADDEDNRITRNLCYANAGFNVPRDAKSGHYSFASLGTKYNRKKMRRIHSLSPLILAISARNKKIKLLESEANYRKESYEYRLDISQNRNARYKYVTTIMAIIMAIGSIYLEW